jgi:hypothetical protein
MSRSIVLSFLLEVVLLGSNSFSCFLLIWVSWMELTSYLKEEDNCTEPSPSFSVPWLK